MRWVYFISTKLIPSTLLFQAEPLFRLCTKQYIISVLAGDLCGGPPGVLLPSLTPVFQGWNHSRHVLFCHVSKSPVVFRGSIEQLPLAVQHISCFLLTGSSSAALFVIQLVMIYTSAEPALFYVFHPIIGNWSLQSSTLSLHFFEKQLKLRVQIIGGLSWSTCI